MALIEFQNNQPPYLNAENLNNNFNELKGEVLWVNANPTSQFAGQGIDLGKDLTGYSKIDILFDAFAPFENYQYFSTKYSNYTFSVTSIAYSSGVIVRTRAISFPNTSTISFGDGYQDSTLDNSKLVPIKIVAYK